MDIKTVAKKNDSKPNTNITKTRTLSIGLPYIRGLSEKLTPIFKQHGIGTYSTNPVQLPKIIACASYKHKPRTTTNAGWYYKLHCLDSGETYIAETGSTLSCRMREHTNQREPTTAVREYHISMKRHKITEEEVKY